MSKIFITGDRTPTPLYLPLIAVEMLRAQAAGATIVTGDRGPHGVEACVRDLAALAGIEVEVVEMNVAGDKPTPDEWDARHAQLVADEIEVIVIHADPHTSSVVKSLYRTTSDDAVRLVTPADLLV